MYPVTDTFLSSVRKSHISKTKVEIYDTANGNILSMVSPIGGEVTIDSRRSVRRQCSLEFVDADGTLVPTNNRSSVLLPYNREVKIYRGIQYQDGTEELAAEQKLARQIVDIRIKNAEQLAKISEQIRKDAAKPIESTKTKLTDFNAEIKAQRDAEDLRISLMEEGAEKEIALADAKYAKLRDAANGDATLLKQIAQQNADAVTQIEQDAAAKRKANEFAVQDAKLASASQALGAINQLVGAFAKGDEKRAKAAFKVQKAVSIAQATVDTYKGANAIFASAAANPSTVLFPAQPFIAAAAAIAAGIANVATISQQQFQGGGGGGGNTETAPPSLGGGEGGVTVPQFNPLAGLNIADRPEQVTPRAYVLAGDVASQQEVRQKVEDLSRIG